MRPPALEIRLYLTAPGLGWAYLAKLKGEAVGEGDGFDKPGEAFTAALAEVKAAHAAASPAPTFDGGEP